MARLTRRALLSTLATGVVAVSTGCASGVTEPTEESASVEALAIGESATSGDGTAVTIDEPRVRYIILTPDAGSVVHLRPAGEPGSNFLVLSVSADAAADAPLALAPVLDGNRRSVDRYRLSVRPDPSRHEIAFAIPAGDLDGVAIEWEPASGERYRWRLPSRIPARLGSTPDFAVERFAVPESIDFGDSFRGEVTVTNAGDRDGRFLGMVLSRGESSLQLGGIELPVPVGESVTRDVTGRPLHEDRETVTAVLDWGLGRQERTVRVSERPTAENATE